RFEHQVHRRRPRGHRRHGRKRRAAPGPYHHGLADEHPQPGRQALLGGHADAARTGLEACSHTACAPGPTHRMRLSPDNKRMETSYATSEPTRAEVDALDGATVLEFGTGWCGWCRAAQPLIAGAFASSPDVR